MGCAMRLRWTVALAFLAPWRFIGLGHGNLSIRRTRKTAGWLTDSLPLPLFLIPMPSDPPGLARDLMFERQSDSLSKSKISRAWRSRTAYDLMYKYSFQGYLSFLCICKKIPIRKIGLAALIVPLDGAKTIALYVLTYT